MDSPRIIKYRLDPTKIYTMTKLLEDGTMQVKGLGEVGWELQIGFGANVGSWFTTAIQEIIVIGKGVLIETLNSTYLIEETSFKDEGKKGASKK